ncbi:MAG: hypothetical protein ABSC23_12520 [Bryobacteraceae bacterium]|jgi:anaerobic selenocysteine-containing dehydrogenase
MQTTRRDIFKFAGGSALGILFTPVPWRLITDAALWSENWPGSPRPASGEITFKFTNCALCPAGCAVRARCVNGQPVSMAGAPGSPLSRGALCPFGVAGHQAPYHPERLKQGPAQEAAAAVAHAIATRGPQEKIAVLDLRPGRAASWLYRRAMAAIPNGIYLAPPLPLGGAAADLAKARTVLSFGAPLFDGWGTPGNVLAARSGFRLIQAEQWESRTAALADLWLPIQPGSASALALGIANALIARQTPHAAGAPAWLLEKAKDFPLAKAAAATGLEERQIASLADELVHNGPSLVLAEGGLPEALALNLLAGGWGETIVARPEAPVPESWKNAAPVVDLASVPDGSIRALLIDESAPGEYIPWNAIEKKLVRQNAVVVTFGWSRAGYGRHSQFTLPAAVYPEVAGDIPPAPDSPVAMFRIAVPLAAPPAGMIDPAEFIAKAAGIEAGNPLRERADAIHKAGRGTLVTYADGKSTPVKELKPNDFWKGLNDGACWIDAPVGQASRPAFQFFRAPEDRPTPATESAALPLVVALTETRAAMLPASPLTSKLYRESNLLLGPNRAALHPDSARACDLAEGGRAVLQTTLGKCEIEVVLDVSLPPGVIAVAAGPEAVDLCGASARAKVVKA